MARTSFAGHVGCVSIYDKSLCETENTYQFKSESASWELPKELFKEKLVSYLDYFLPGHTVQMGSVFLWVNDFNSVSALRLQVWEAGRSVILDIPADLNNITIGSDITMRAAGAMPYPIDFGHTLGEIMALCIDACTAVHNSWLAEEGISNVRVLLPNILSLAVPFFTEAATVQSLKNKENFEALFRSIELSPVLEGNGFRQHAFTLYF